MKIKMCSYYIGCDNFEKSPRKCRQIIKTGSSHDTWIAKCLIDDPLEYLLYELELQKENERTYSFP